MSLPATIGTSSTTPTLTPTERAVLYYDADAMLAYPRTFMQALRVARRKTGLMAQAAPLSLMIGTVGGAATAAAAAVATHLLGGSNDLAGTIALIGAAGGSVPSLLISFRDLVQGSLNYKTDEALKRIEEMTSVCIDSSNMEAMKMARMFAKTEPRDLDRTTLVRLDIVATALLATIRKAGPDEQLAQAARAKAERAVSAIMSSVRMEDPDLPALEASRVLDQVCTSMIGRSPVPVRAPTARVARILALAEQALASHPDIVDASGARLDRLVREHVPLLLSLREEAIRTAPDNTLDAVDENFSLAFDGIAASIEEAMKSIHDEAMDRLSTQVRFLAARRNDDRLLSIAP